MKNESLQNYSFKEYIKTQLDNKNIQLSDRQINNLEKYKDLLLEWNEKINLTAIIDEKEIIIKHFIDCLECINYLKEGNNIIDIGTGAGFPGLVIAIYYEGKVKITLVDALNKRVAFLEEVVKQLSLKNVEIIHARAEELGSKIEYREKYDFAVSRAVASLNVLLEYTIPFIKINGKALYMKGNNVNEEIEKANNALKILNCEINKCMKYSLVTKDETFERYILEVLKLKQTLSKYPRIYGKIKKSPL